MNKLNFDLNDKQTFANIERWIKLMEENQANNALKVLIGNKSDFLRKDVEKEEIQNLCSEFKLPYFEVSAKNGQNINEPFEFMAKLVKKQYLDTLADSMFIMKDSVQSKVKLSEPIQLNDSKSQEISDKSCCGN